MGWLSEFLVDGRFSIDRVDRVLVDVNGDAATVIAQINSRAAHEVERILDRDELGVENA